MKRFLTFTLGLSLLAATATAAPVVETFDRGGFVKLDDTNAANNSVVRRAYNTTTSTGTGFIWGGFSAFSGTAAPGLAFNTNTQAAELQFNKNGASIGSYAYTRFDTSTIATEGTADTGSYTTPSVILDMSLPVSKATLTVNYNGLTNLKLAVLIRDDQKWWQSSAADIEIAGSPTANALRDYDFVFVGGNPVTWTQVDISETATPAGGFDMDQVDSKGEAGLALLSTGTPNFTQIQGMGFIVTDVVFNVNLNFAVTTMTLDTPDVTAPAAPTGLAATSTGTQISLNWNDNTEGDLAGYNVYRSTTQGSGYAKINGSAVVTSRYCRMLCLKGSEEKSAEA